jgi:hypothetical protein
MLLWEGYRRHTGPEYSSESPNSSRFSFVQLSEPPDQRRGFHHQGAAVSFSVAFCMVIVTHRAATPTHRGSSPTPTFLRLNAKNWRPDASHSLSSAGARPGLGSLSDGHVSHRFSRTSPRLPRAVSSTSSFAQPHPAGEARPGATWRGRPLGGWPDRAGRLRSTLPPPPPERVSLMSHTATLHKVRSRPSSVSVQPPRETETSPQRKALWASACLAPGYYAPSLEWLRDQQASASSAYRAPGREEATHRMTRSLQLHALEWQSPVDVAGCRDASMWPTTTSSVSARERHTSSSRCKRKPRSTSFFSNNTMSLQGARPELLSPIGPPPHSPAQRAIEQANLGHRLAMSVVLPATDHALQRFAMQGKDVDPHATPEIRPGSRSLKILPEHTLLVI